MLRSLGDDGRYLNAEWHRFRQEALETSFSLDEWDDPPKSEYDLEDLSFDRRAKDSHYLTRPRIEAESGPNAGVDLRDFDGPRS